MNNLFTMGATNGQGSAKALDKTAQLTAIAEAVAKNILNQIESAPSEYSDKCVASQQSHEAMDELIADLYQLSTIDLNFLTDLDSETADKMIRSQQSKRSRTKSKTMTRDNYLAMTTGAVAEWMLRVACNKPKSSVGGGASVKPVDYTDAEIETLKNDPDKLAKAIRNIQSKKSIYKSKTGFDETSERWQQLLAAEQQLKAIRDGITPTATVVVEKAKAADDIQELLKDIDITKLKSADGKDLLAKIQAMIVPTVSGDAASEAAVEAVNTDEITE